MSIYKKLLDFQGRVSMIKKDGKNPHFKSNYATLPQIISEVKPLLTEVGIVLLQPVNDNMVGTVIVDSESGESVAANMQLPDGLNPQQIGSAITYYRRYLLAGLLSLEIDDDDGNAASQKPPPVKVQRQAEDAGTFVKKTIEEINKATSKNSLMKLKTAVVAAEGRGDIKAADSMTLINMMKEKAKGLA